MIFARLLALAMAGGIGVSLALYFFTGERNYVLFCLRLLKISMVLAALGLAMLVLERLVLV